MGIKQILLLIFILISVCNFGQDPCQIGANISLPLLDVENPQNLYQCAYPCFYYLLNSSNVVIINNLRPFYVDGSFIIINEGLLSKINYGGTCPSAGTVVIGVCHYSENTGELGQRAWYAINKITLNSEIAEGSAIGFVEVPHVFAAKNGTGVRISWQAVPANDAVIGYRVIRSANGLSNWETVGDTTGLYLDDSPGVGTWYYALEVKFAGSPTTYTSRHGLLAMIALEGE